MKFGILHGVCDPHWRESILHPSPAIEFARAVEHAGFSCLAFSDQPAPPGRWLDEGGGGALDPFTALGFCAAATGALRLLTLAVNLPCHNPFALAHRVASLDALSGGRLTLGMGCGTLKSEYRALGVEFDQRQNLFEQHLKILLEAFTGGDVSARSERYAAGGVRLQPPLVQAPHPPLWIEGQDSWSLEQAAAHAQGWIGQFTTGATRHTRPMPDNDSLRQRLDELQQALHPHQRSLDDIEIIIVSAIPPLDIRRGWEHDAYQQRFAELRALGVDTIIVESVGDDPVAAEDSALRFAEEFIGPQDESAEVP